jgi:eukaryotic-like serine/threonine-protein kinase
VSSAEAARWSILDAAFTSALDRPESERQAWLHKELASDPDALAGVLQLLQNEKSSRARFDDLLSIRDRVAGDLATHLSDAAEDPRIGADYGPWRILRRIASGGLSVVYEACRSDGRYEQLVALKVMHGGMHKGEVIRHFLRERRILSSLDHPGIVRILDGGETATGAPWFVMDLAPGKPVTDYCRDSGLNLNARLSLLAEITDAVQSAHARLVVHRDIKPDNIIVSEEGRARLLDFGVSSLFAEEGVEEAGHAMTPGYASPEQLRLETVTTASDIWQLGRVAREICEPLQPLPADVLAVIDKATSERAENRYETAAGLSSDLRRLVEGQAPLARPDTRMQAVLRFIRRNKTAAALGILLLCGLIGWGATLSVHAREMERQRAIAVAAADRAERGRSVLLDLFRRLDPLERDGVPSVLGGAGSLVDPTLTDVRNRLPDDPLLQAELVGWAARIRQRADHLDEARSLAQESVELLREADDMPSTSYAAALAYLGHLDMERGEMAPANVELAEALSIATDAPLDDPQAFEAILSAAWAAGSDWQRVRELFELALPRALATGSVNGEIEVRSGLGRTLGNLGLMEDGEAEIRKALAIAEDVYGPDHPRLTLPFSDLGRMLSTLGRNDEAVAAHQRAVRIAVSSYGPDSKKVLEHRNNLAIALAGTGRTEEAIAELETLVTLWEQNEGPESLSTGEALQNLAVQQVVAGRLEDALGSLERSGPIFKAELPEGSPRRVFPALTRSAVLLELGNYSEAENSAREAYDTLTLTLPKGHYATEIARCRIGLAKLGLGDAAAARPLLTDGLAALADQPAAPPAYVTQCEVAGRKLGIVK